MMSSKKRFGAAAAAVAAIALLAGGLASPATAATGKATVKGVVKLDGKPVKFARVQLYRDMGDDVDDPSHYKRVKTANTDSKGRYKISGVSLIKLSPEAAGYWIVVSDRSGKFVKTNRPVHLKAGKVVTRNVKTLPAAIIKGKITRSDGGDPRDLTVTIDDGERGDYDVPQFIPNMDATIKADGTFKIGGVAPNGYRALRVKGKPYAQQCFTPATGTLADCDGTSAQWIKMSARQRLKIPALTITKLR
jgi:hypothetical protein